MGPGSASWKRLPHLVRMYAGIAVTTPAPKLPSFLVNQQHPTVSADSASSQPYPDSVRNLS